MRGESGVSHRNGAIQRCPLFGPVHFSSLPTCTSAADVVLWQHTIQLSGPVIQHYKRAVMGYSIGRHVISSAAQL